VICDLDFKTAGKFAAARAAHRRLRRFAKDVKNSFAPKHRSLMANAYTYTFGSIGVLAALDLKRADGVDQGRGRTQRPAREYGTGSRRRCTRTACISCSDQVHHKQSSSPRFDKKTGQSCGEWSAKKTKAGHSVPSGKRAAAESSPAATGKVVPTILKVSS